MIGSWFAISAYEGKQFIGCGRLISDGTTCAMLTDLTVKRTHRRRGVATSILIRLVARCREYGIREIRLFSTPALRQFFERRSFTSDDTAAVAMVMAIEDEKL